MEEINIRKRDPITSCFVPICKNRVITSPAKHFFRVPTRNKEEWCVAVGKPNVPKGALYICEDHINVEEDLLNYNEWKSNLKNVFGILKVEVPNLRNILLPPAETEQIATTSFTLQSEANVNKSTMCQPEAQHKYVQVKPKTADRCTQISQPLKKIRKSIEKRTTGEEIITEDISGNQTPSIIGSTTEYSETESSVNISIPKKDLGVRENILNLLKQKPKTYLGLPKPLFWVINYLEKHSHVSSLHVSITLYKIKNNDTFEKISEFFTISTVTLWRIFYNTLPVLKSFFQQFIFWPEAIDIKRNLPLAFRTNAVYANVQSIIDCFEIEIEKPKKPIEQSLTWSEYKSCNTIKYLVSATPDGFINFVSEGYGARISDINLVEQSSFLEIVPLNCTILADRGFKHLESHLKNKNVKVLRPPSVSKDCKMSKAEAIESKVIASLRVHIERVIRRVRLYRILKPHSVVNNKLVKSLDDVVLVACGLINLQSPNIQNC